jgi:Fe-S-cluster containining protein
VSKTPDDVPEAAGDPTGRLDRALVQLAPVKRALVRASGRAAARVRSCDGCPAKCCRAGLNSMKITRIEAEALRRRLVGPDLAPLVPEILRRAEAEVARRGLKDGPSATYDCPLLSPTGRCLVHGPAQPAGCLTFRPVPDGGCDHDLPLFHRKEPEIARAERAAWGRLAPVLSIPEALLRLFRR